MSDRWIACCLHSEFYFDSKAELLSSASYPGGQHTPARHNSEDSEMDGELMDVRGPVYGKVDVYGPRYPRTFGFYGPQSENVHIERRSRLS
jgi:hypothetical protein